jgi:uncharacterized membrane protein YtjA (UPF0391 family)
MLNYSIVFLAVALIAGLLGFSDSITAGAVEIARNLFFVFILLFVASFVAGLLRNN